MKLYPVKYKEKAWNRGTQSLCYVRKRKGLIRAGRRVGSAGPRVGSDQANGGSVRVGSDQAKC